MGSEESSVLSPAEFGRLLQRFMNASLALAPSDEPEVARRLREHLGAERLVDLPIVSRDFAVHDHPNLQVAIDRLLEGGAWSAEIVGLRSQEVVYGQESLGRIALLGGGDEAETPGLAIGALERVTVAVGGGESISCLVNALLLLRAGDLALAALIGRTDEPMGNRVRLEVIAADRALGERWLADVQVLMREHNVYRGRIVTFGAQPWGHGDAPLTVRTLPRVEREAIVLPDGALERIERHALGPVRHRERLLAAGRHLKRGLLLHGPPGTGKTLTAMYLTSRMPGRTTVLLTGAALGLVESACALARELQPATVVLEDVDLVAQERDYDDPSRPVLFQLLNEMDGLAEDADVLFVLTTNRADVLEPALAARPGRIDQAVELPLPDAEHRRRLIELYARGLTLRATRLDELVERLEGASPAHVKELLRKAALLAAEDGDGPIVVEDRHLEAAADELVIVAGEVRASLAGGPPGVAMFPFPEDE